MGLVEWEWLVTLATLEPDDVIYTDFVDVARELVPELQNEVWELSFNAIHIHVRTYDIHEYFSLYTCVSTIHMYLCHKKLLLLFIYQ